MGRASHTKAAGRCVLWGAGRRRCLCGWAPSSRPCLCRGTSDPTQASFPHILGVTSWKMPASPQRNPSWPCLKGELAHLLGQKTGAFWGGLEFPPLASAGQGGDPRGVVLQGLEMSLLCSPRPVCGTAWRGPWLSCHLAAWPGRPLLGHVPLRSGVTATQGPGEGRLLP